MNIENFNLNNVTFPIKIAIMEIVNKHENHVNESQYRLPYLGL